MHDATKARAMPWVPVLQCVCIMTLQPIIRVATIQLQRVWCSYDNAIDHCEGHKCDALTELDSDGRASHSIRHMLDNIWNDMAISHG
eukprot:scaffold353279_cov25-Prasinocladus_malaysianus.AAC.1